MELDAFDRELAVSDAHHLAVGRPGRDLELVGNLDGRERVVAAGLEMLRQSCEDTLAVVLDERGLSVQQRLRLADRTAEGLDDRLVTEADSEPGAEHEECLNKLAALEAAIDLAEAEFCS